MLGRAAYSSLISSVYDTLYVKNTIIYTYGATTSLSYCALINVKGMVISMEKKRLLFIVKSIVNGVFTYIVELVNGLVNTYYLYNAYTVGSQTPTDTTVGEVMIA